MQKLNSNIFSPARFACYLLLIYHSNVLAAPPKQSPSFNTFWYSNATYVSTSNEPCDLNVGYYSYTNKGNSRDAVANQIYASLPHKTNCTWDQTPIYTSDINLPPDFPTTNDEFYAIEKSSPNEWFANFLCKNSQGTVVTTSGGMVYPSYSCPVGTVALSDGTLLLACYSYVYPACGADIPGRDLILTGFTEYGHVGIATPLECPSDKDDCSAGYDDSPVTSGVFEVLDEDTQDHSVIFADSLTGFMNKSPYWGLKYDLPKHPINSFDFARIANIAVSLYAQPSDYTYFWHYRPAGVYTYWTLQNGLSHQVTGPLPGLYRCDSFVYYCFKAASLNIPYSGIMTPLAIYNTFINQRNNSSIFTTAKSSKASLAKNSLEDQITAVFEANQFDQSQADDLTQQYINDNTISLTEKINYFWNLSLNYKTDSSKYNYLMNSLGYIKCYQLADDLINTYQVVTDENIRNALILAMSQSTYFDTKAEVDALSQEDINNITKIQNFLAQIEETESNTHLAGTALLNIVPSLSYEKANSMLDTSISKNKKILTMKTFYLEKIALLFKVTSSLQAAELQKMIKKYQHDDMFTVSLFFVDRYYPIKKLSTETNIIIKSYLKNNKNILDTSKDPWLVKYKKIDASITKSLNKL